MPKAAPSTRSSGQVTLSFGLVNIPIALYAGTVATAGIERHEYLPVATTDDQGNTTIEDHPVGRGKIDKVTGELIPVESLADIQRKIETEYGPVYVEDSEIEKLFTLEPDTLKIKEFQPQTLFYQGNYVPKGLMFLEPQKSGTGKKRGYMAVASKLFATLLKGMREEGVVAVAELTTRGVPKPCILLPDGSLWLVWHTDAIREQRELPDAPLVDAEVNMMRGLISTLTKNEVADLTDYRSELIQTFADEKAEQGDFAKPVDTYETKQVQDASTDLMALLAASVEAAKQAS